MPDRDYTERCIETGNVHMLTYYHLLDHKPTTILPTDLLRVPSQDKDAMRVFLFDHCVNVSNTLKSQNLLAQFLKQLAMRGKLHLIKLVASRISPGVIDYIKLVAFRISPGAIDYSAAVDAATRGRLDIVEYFHFYDYRGCSQSTLQCAINYKHDHVVKYLLRNRWDDYPAVLVDTSYETLTTMQ